MKLSYLMDNGFLKWFLPLTFSVISCAANKPLILERSAFKKSEAIASLEIEFQRDRELYVEHMRATYFVFSLSGVPDAMVGHLSYQGTEKGYHLFMIYQKVTTDNSLAYNIALGERDCEIRNPRPIRQEFEIYNASYRHPSRTAGGCKMDDPKGK